MWHGEDFDEPSMLLTDFSGILLGIIVLSPIVNIAYPTGFLDLRYQVRLRHT